MYQNFFNFIPILLKISMADPLTNSLKPLTDSFLTIRIIKSFEFRTTKNLLIPHCNLITLTVAELKAIVLTGKFNKVSSRKNRKI